jgi:FMN-dependent NADH-azoreductase
VGHVKKETRTRKLLHIIATPHGEDSRTLQISEVFLDELKKRNPDLVVDELDVTKEELPSMTLKRLDGKYVLLDGKELYGDLKDTWQEIISHINRFLSADVYLISTPMWNFSIPYFLKHYIDVIVQPKYLFRYTDNGVDGFAKGRKMLIITSRGDEYEEPESIKLDHQEPYLRSIFGFVGITDITFLIAQPMDNKGHEIQKQKIEEAKERAKKAAEIF